MAGWKRLGIISAIIIAALSVVARASAQTRDPLIDPPSGTEGSRFQVVGQAGWVPGETVTLRLAFTSSAAPLEFAGPFPYEQPLMVLRDGTWSFPVVVTEDALGFPLGDMPGFIVIQVQSATQTATNAWVLTVNGVFPPGSETLAPAGAGPPAPSPALLLTLGLFALGIGGLLITSGMQRRTV